MQHRQNNEKHLTHVSVKDKYHQAITVEIEMFADNSVKMIDEVDMVSMLAAHDSQMRPICTIKVS